MQVIFTQFLNQIKKELQHATEKSYTIKQYITTIAILFILALFCASLLFSIQTINTDALMDYKNVITSQGDTNIIINTPQLLLILVPSILSFMHLFIALFFMIKLIQYTIQEQCDTFKDDIQPKSPNNTKE